ncbi:MAG: hypothetical protein ACOC95_03920 [Planctomycetota bacterium]
MIDVLRVMLLTAVAACASAVTGCAPRSMTYEQYCAKMEEGWAATGFQLSEAEREQALAEGWRAYQLALSGDREPYYRHMRRMNSKARQAAREAEARRLKAKERQYASRSLTEIEREYVRSVRTRGDPDHRSFLLDQVDQKLRRTDDVAERDRLYRKYQQPGQTTALPVEVDAFYDPELYQAVEMFSLRHQLLKSAGKTGDPRLIPLLIPYLEDPTTVGATVHPIRDTAHEALVELAGEDLGTDPDAWTARYGRE